MNTEQPTVPHSFTVSPDPVALFCFSAATWNPHRIHYDADYARTVEGYPDVLVPGPMLGAWLLELADAWAQANALTVTDIEYRNVKPAFVNGSFDVSGREVASESGRSLEVWVADGAYRLCAGVVYAEPAQSEHNPNGRGTDGHEA